MFPSDWVSRVEDFIIGHKWWFICGACYYAGSARMFSRFVKMLSQYVS